MPGPISAFSGLHAETPTTVDSSHVWDLTDLHPTLGAWTAARVEVLGSVELIDTRRGTLGESAASLYETLPLVSSTIRQAGRVWAYSSLSKDEDLRDSETQERHQLTQIMWSRFAEASAWIDPEILRIGSERCTSSKLCR